MSTITGGVSPASVTAQLPAFIFYLGAGAVLLLIAGALEALGERASRKRQRAEIRSARRAQSWTEIEKIARWREITDAMESL